MTRSQDLFGHADGWPSFVSPDMAADLSAMISSAGLAVASEQIAGWTAEQYQGARDWAREASRQIRSAIRSRDIPQPPSWVMEAAR